MIDFINMYSVGLGGEYELLPSLDERMCYFPFIDSDYESVFTPTPGEIYPEGALSRFGSAAQVCSFNVYVSRFYCINMILNGVIFHAGFSR